MKKTSNGISMFDITIPTSSVSYLWVIHQNQCDKLSTQYKIIDFRYNPFWQKIYLLHEVCGTPFHDILSEYDLSLGIPTSASLSWDNIFRLTSVCNYWTDDLSLSAGYNNNNELILFSKKHSIPNPCVKNTNALIENYYPNLYDFENPGIRYNINIFSYTEIPVLFCLDIQTLCED